ncbi:hypothetical protein V1504DRAFT_479002 [Lipomyces starkeyi]
MEADQDSTRSSSEQVNKEVPVQDRAADFDLENRQELLEKLGHGGLAEEALGESQNVDFILEKVSTISTEEAVNILTDAIEYHEDGPNFPQRTMTRIQSLVAALSQGDKGEFYDFDLKLEAVLIGSISPCPEVRSVVDATDDVDTPVESIRAYFLGFLYIIAISGINQFFVTRQPHISIGSAVIQLLLYPSGKVLAMALPDWGFTIRGTRCSLNPVMMGGNISATNVTTNLIPVEHLNVFYGNKCRLSISRPIFVPVYWNGLGWCYASLGGLPNAGTLANNLADYCDEPRLLKDDKATAVHGWSISRYWFFWVIFAISFIYYWVPGYLFTALSTFNWWYS